MSPKAAALHQFTFTMSNYNYRPLFRHDTQLNNHQTLYMNSLKDHYSNIGQPSFLSGALSKLVTTGPGRAKICDLELHSAKVKPQNYVQFFGTPGI